MTEELKTIDVKINDQNEAITLFGNSDDNLKIIEQELQVSVITRGETLILSGSPDQLDQAGKVIDKLLQVIKKGIAIGPERC